MIDKYRQISWAVTAPFVGALGLAKLKKIASLQDRAAWSRSFTGRKILIVGTGPSLDTVDEKYFGGFDVIIYINHAVKCAGKVKDEYFFSTDVNVVKGIGKKPYYRNIVLFGKDKSVLAPVFFQQTLAVPREFLENFTWIRPSGVKYNIHRTSKRYAGIRLPVSLVLWPKQPIKKDLDIWFSQREQVDYFPVVESTSALSAILLASKYSPHSVTLIGCDFGAGRSKNIEDDYPAHEVNVFQNARNIFVYLREYLSNWNIPVNNDSWNE